MKKILFVGGRYYPKASPNSICIQNIINELSSEDNDVAVLCYKDGLEDSTKARTIKISRGFIQTALYHLEEKNGHFYQTVTRVLKTLQKLKQIVFFVVWPWCDPIITLREVHAAEKYYQTQEYDVIVAVHMPLSSLITGHIIKQRHSHVQYIAYFLDSLSGGAAPRFMNDNTYNRKALKWEKKLLNNADDIVFMESSKEYHERIYHNTDFDSKITYLDLPMLIRSPDVLYETYEHQTTLFVYVGSLASSVRSPAFFLKVFSSVDDKNWRLMFIGDNTCDLINEYAKKDKRIKVIGRCTHEEALQFEKQATVLLNLGNKNVNLTPSKVFEYMSFCKKIVSTYPIDNESSAVYLRKYPCALLLDERGDISKAAHELQSFVEKKQCSFDYNDVKTVFFNNTPEAFIHILGNSF